MRRARQFPFRRVVPLPGEQAGYRQAHRFKQRLRRLFQWEPAVFGKRPVTGLWNRSLVANIAQELYVDIMTVVSNDVAQAKHAELTHGDTQFLQGLPAGTLLQGLTEFQVPSGGTPRRLPVGPQPLRQEHFAAPDENHPNTYQRPVFRSTHRRSIARRPISPEFPTTRSLVVCPERRMLDFPTLNTPEFSLMSTGTVDELPRSSTGLTALAVCDTAARRAGALVVERFRSDVEVSLKGRANVVTDADLASEQLILDYVGQEYPDFGILSEESAPVAGSSPYTWVVDPIDGTRNFAEGIPHFCVVVAIADGDQVVAGVTYDPVRDEMFAAQRGRGATLNGEPIHVSDRQDIDEAVLGFDLGYNFDQAKHLLELAAGVWPQVQGYRLMGSSALSLAYAACGRVDLYFHHSLSAWDIASGVLLAREAGGQVLDRATLEDATLFSPGLIVSNPALVKQFLALTDGMAWRSM